MNTTACNCTELVAKLFLAFMLLTIGIVAYAAPPKAPPGLFQASHMPSHPQLPPNAMAGKTRFVQVNPAQLKSDRLTLNLLDNQTYTAKRKRWVENPNGSTVWLGSVEGMDDSEISLATYGQAVAGTIRVGKKMYSIRYSGDGVQTLSEVSASEPLPEVGPVVTSYDTTSGTTGTSSTTTSPSGDTGAVIDVLVMYTPASRVANGGSDGMQAFIALAVAETNQAYLNSSVDTSLRLTYSAETPYTESGNMIGDLGRLAAPDDGFMDEVSALRDAYSADLVSLIEESSQYCGVSYQMTTEGAAFAGHAFSVVASQCATGYYSFGHELGHNMGLTHDHFSAVVPGVDPYSYGYWDPNFAFRTIMAYDCPGGCPRIQHFSNPRVTYNGLPTGTDYALDPANAADNSATLNETAPIVAQFRDSAQAGPPAAPTNLVAFTAGADSVELNWTDNSTTESGYLVERSDDQSGFVQIASLDRNTTGFADTGLAPATTYGYRVQAVNPAGDSAPSNVATAGTPDPSLDIQQQSDGEVSVAGVVSGDYSLTWAADGSAESIREVTSHGSPRSRYGYLEHVWAFDLQTASVQELDVTAWTDPSAIDSFTFAYSTDGSTYTDMFSVGAANGGPMTFTLPAGISGRVYVRVIDNLRVAGFAASSTVYVDQLTVRSMSTLGAAPVAPSGLAASAVSADGISLSWADNSSNELGFRIESSGDGTAWTWLANVGADLTGYADSGLAPGSTHYYRVRAFSDAGVSALAGPVAATTQALPPIPLSVTLGKAKGKTAADLAWSGATTSKVDIYRDGSALVVGTKNDGSYADPLNLSSGSFTYRVCQAGSSALCSADVLLSF